jgi:uncharacterized membrane protein
MDGDRVRIVALERRVLDLEHRVLLLEPARPPASSEREAEAAMPAAPVAAPMWEPAASVLAVGSPVARGAVHSPAPPVERAARPAWGAQTAPAARPPRAEPRRLSTASEAAAPEAAAPEAAAPVTMSLKDLEERFAGRALAWVGGVALVAAAVFFLSLAFSRGWITEPMRIVVGLAAGTAAFGVGAVMLARKSPLVGNVLAGVGLGIVSITMLAATRLYHLVPPEVGLAVALVAALAAAVVAVRLDARSVAAYGLIAALAAPPLVGASPTLLTLMFVAVTLVGTTAVALFRSWPWLPSLAFVLAAPQLASWVSGDPEPVQALVALAGFWLVNIVAAAGEEMRIRRDDLRPSSAILVLANGIFLLWGLHAVLIGDLAPWLGLAIALAAAAHLGVGAWFLARQGMEHLFGNLVAGTGVALLAIAAFVQLGAPVVPVAWAAEAVALAWLAVRRRHRWSAAAALVLGGLALSHLVLLEYPLTEAGIPAAFTFDPPLVHAEGGSLLAVLLALGMAAAFVPIRWIRSVLAGTGVLVAAYAATFEATGPVLAGALVLAALAGLLLDRLAARLGTAEGLDPVAHWTGAGWFGTAAGACAGAMAVVLLFSTEFPRQDLGTLAATPFLNEACASLAVVLVGLGAAAALVPVRWVRSALGGLGILLVAWGLAFQVTGVTLVALLAVLLPAGVILDRGLGRLPDDERFAPLPGRVPFGLFATAGGAIAWMASALYSVATFLEPTQWGVVTPPPVAFTDQRALVAALLAGAALAAARWLLPVVLRRVAVIAALVTVAWVVPFEVYADLVVVLWVALAALSVLLIRWDGPGSPAYAGLGATLWIGGAAVAFGIVARPDRLWVVDTAIVDRAPLLALWPLSFVALAAGAASASRHRAFPEWRTWLEVLAGTLVVYAISVGVVDVFQRQVGGPLAVEELAKQAQVALSVCWTAIGLVCLVTALMRHDVMLRHAGFALLALATAKVFVIDLASMDVAYRAVVLAGLGLLLLASAYVFTRFRGPRAGPSGLAGGPHAAA